ncbi:MAG: efflux RND transporter periplasmic adaptor subunit [Bacteroidota bacterium]
MNKLITSLIVSCGILIMGCKSNDPNAEEAVQKPRVPVEITTINHGFVNDELELFATTAYLSRNIVTAPIPAYITRVNIRIGDLVGRGQLLYELETKERRALGNQPVLYDSSLAGYGKIKVTASTPGIITAIDRQQAGDYVLEGASLCTITEGDGMVFQVNVPFEFVKYVKAGNPCTIVLPDNTKHTAVFTKPLTAMNVTAQTQNILARTSETLILPEGLVAKVLVNKGSGNNNQVLPKACVLSDEMMQHYWIMKLIDDSTAVKVPVIIGNKNKDDIEILSPQFTANDKILSAGNYGLPDTAFVKIFLKK